MITQFDQLSTYFGEPLEIGKGFTVKQATIGDIIRLGEKKYWNIVNVLTAIPSDYISVLHDAGLNYMDLSDMEFFAILKSGLSQEDTSIFFGDFDFGKLEPGKREDGTLVLVNKETGFVLDEVNYSIMTKYLCTVHMIKKKRRKAGNKRTYELQVEVDRQDRKQAAAKSDKSHLLPMISSLVNHPGFKYGIQDVKSLTLYQFIDCVNRITTITATERIAHGYYSGNIDPKKINIKKELDWMRDLQA